MRQVETGETNYNREQVWVGGAGLRTKKTGGTEKHRGTELNKMKKKVK